MAATRLCGVVAVVAVDGSGDSWSVAGRSNRNSVIDGRFRSGQSPASAIWHARAERRPLQVLIRANELANASHETFAGPMHELRNNPDLLDAHLDESFRKSRATAGPD